MGRGTDRKWLVGEAPKGVRVKKIEYLRHSFISVNPEIEITSIAEDADSAPVKYMVRLKASGDAINNELESSISKQVYSNLLGAVNGNYIEEKVTTYEYQPRLKLELHESPGRSTMLVVKGFNSAAEASLHEPKKCITDIATKDISSSTTHTMRMMWQSAFTQNT